MIWALIIAIASIYLVWIYLIFFKKQKGRFKMNVGFDFAFSGGTKRISLDTVIINSIQYLGYIKSITPFEFALSEEGEYEMSSITVVIDNVNGTWDQYKTSASYGVEVTLRETDNTIITTKFIEEYSGDDQKIVFVISDHYSEINKILPAEYINQEEFPNAIGKSLGQPIPYYFGHFMKPYPTGYFGENMVKAWYVNLDATHEYLIGKAGASGINSIELIHDPDGTDITVDCALTSSGDYYCINYTGGAGPWDYILVNFQYDADKKSYELIGELGTALFSDYTLDVTNISTILPDRGYDREPLATHRKISPHFFVHKNRKGKEIFADICRSFNLEYYIDSSKNIVFTIIDYESLTASGTFKEVEILRFTYLSEDTEKLKNIIIGRGGYYLPDDEYRQECKLIKQQSIDDNNITSTKELEIPYIPWEMGGALPGVAYKIYATSKYYAIEHQSAERRAIIEMDIDKAIDLKPSDYIEFPHSDAIDDTTRLYQIKKISFDYMNDLAIIEIKDIDDLTSLRINDMFLLQPNGVNGSAISYDDSVGKNHSTFGATHAIAKKKHGTTSMVFNGVDDAMMAVAGDDYDAWDIFIQTNVTIDMWIAFDGLGSVEYVASQVEDDNNRWYIYKDANDKMNFGMDSDGVQKILTTSDTAVPDANFHHWLLVKKGNEYAWYLAGSQDSYLSDADTDQFASNLTIGTDGLAAPGNYFDGNLALLRIAHDDPYSTTPVVAKTDTITVPTRMLRDNGF